MTFDLQTTLALTIVALATAWMLRRLLFCGNGNTACGPCKGCSPDASVSRTQDDAKRPKKIYQLTESDR
jgi:hypothetical protein